MRYVRCLCILLVVALGTATSAAQDAPLISGAAGFISTTDGGHTSLQPVIAPVAVIPLGSRFDLESRADIRGLYQRESGNGPYSGELFTTLEYFQLDYIATPKLTFSAGRYLTPFGVYNERLTAIWIRNFQDAPLIYPIGTRTSGSSDGAMLRGTLFTSSKWRLNYTGYFSASSNAEQIQSGRAAGGRASIFVPDHRVEFGASYQRFLEGTHLNSVGAHLFWQPWRLPVETKAEYAHSPSGQGYWIEVARRLPAASGHAWTARLQPVVRMQQFFRHTQIAGDDLPRVNTQRADFGLNYYLPHEVRLNASYARQFTAIVDSNVWTVSATYRFLFPVAFGRTR